jgi:hypothetical protein
LVPILPIAAVAEFSAPQDSCVPQARALSAVVPLDLVIVMVCLPMVANMQTPAFRQIRPIVVVVALAVVLHMPMGFAWVARAQSEAALQGIATAMVCLPMDANTTIPDSAPIPEIVAGVVWPAHLPMPPALARVVCVRLPVAMLDLAIVTV